MFSIHEAMSNLLALFHVNGRTSLQTCRSEDRTPSSFRIFISQGCNTPEDKHMSPGRSKNTVHSPGVRCIARMVAVRSMQYDRPRSRSELELSKTANQLQTAQPFSTYSFHIFCAGRQVDKTAGQNFESVTLSPCSPFLGHEGSGRKQMFLTCTPCSPPNQRTTTVMVFQKP